MTPDLPVPAVATKARSRLFKVNLRTSFLTGVVVSAPIAITVFLVLSFVTFVDDQVRPIVFGVIPPAWQRAVDHYAAIPGLGLVLVAASLTVIGMLTANMVGRAFLSFGDSVARRTPIVGTIYRTLRQIIETIIAQTEPAFKQVALIEYPTKGMWRIVFVVGPAKSQMQSQFEEEMLTVFMPSTPNPMAGYLSFMPKTAVRILPLSIEDGLKMVVSAGIVQPDHVPAPAPARRPGLLDRWAAKLRPQTKAA